MGLKILHSADWHLDSPFTGYSEKQRTILKQEQRKIPEKVAQLARRENCDILLLAGDIFDGAASRESIDLLKKALGGCGMPVFISPGNHDFCTPGSPWLEEAWPENVHVFTGRLESVVVPELNCRVYGAGYKAMDCGPLLEGFRTEGTEKYHIAVLHGDPTQKNSPCCPITGAQVRSSGLHYLALGHIHKAGAFRAGETLCAWPGCPMGRGWDETGEKGVCIVTLADIADIRAVSLDTLRFCELNVDIGEDAAEALGKVLPAAGGEDFYRVTLTGSGAVDIGELKHKFAAFPNLELRDKTEPPLDVWADAGEDTLEGVYFHMLRKALDTDPKNAKHIQLAAEISRKLLEGREVVL